MNDTTIDSILEAFHQLPTIKFRAKIRKIEPANNSGLPAIYFKVAGYDLMATLETVRIALR